MRKKTIQSSKANASSKGAFALKEKKARLLPVIPLFFLLVWAWGTFYYGQVFLVSREYSFWVPDSRQMQFILTCPFGWLRYIGRALLQLFHYPWLGGLLLAFLLSFGSWLLGYAMRLKPAWRPIQYLPALGYMGTVTYLGLDIYFEAETGYILGIPFLLVLILCIWAVMIRSFSRKPMPVLLRIPQDETPRQNYTQIAVLLLGMSTVIGFNEWKRPYVRVISELMSLQYQQRWTDIQQVARAHAIQSNRPMACYYAISLIHTNQIADRMYDIRLDYDSLYIHGMDNHHNNANALYLPEGNYHGGFVQSCQHACMEQMVMNGPTIRLLKLQIKSALMRSEWELARKYLRILRDVPFEGTFCRKYGAMVQQPQMINADPEMAKIRLTEPIHDSFENMYQQPLFMGYNLSLLEGRSKNALINSLCVCLYTKVMPPFMQRLEPIMGTTPPEIIADGILLASTKEPGLENQFRGLEFRTSRMNQFLQNIQPYMKDRPGHAYELFPKYKGYYPYYYFFGNLKATKKGVTGNQTSNSGVN